MSSIGKKKGRLTSGRKPRGGSLDKAILNDGVYANPRMTHVATTLIGCNVQVCVKNGGIYEGIFKTFSPKMEVALEMVHKVENVATNGNPTMVPSRDRLVEKLLFNYQDIVTISALNVDLEYACKDSFTDSAISNYNGQTVEKELQPWESDGTELQMETLETAGATAATSNGWDPEDMFKINQTKFQVASSYDPSLAIYTTPLNKEDSKEYREREAQAAKLAHEIEKSDDYRKHIDLENGDGDDEEMAYSAVHRTNNDHNGTGGNRYVAPHKRTNPQQGRAMRQTNMPSPSRHQHSPQHTPPTQGPLSSSPHNAQGPPAQQGHHRQTSPQPVQVSAGGVEVHVETKPGKPDNVGDVPEHGQDCPSPQVVSIRDNMQRNDKDQSAHNKLEQNSKQHQNREQQMTELRHFSSTFKLQEAEKERKAKSALAAATSPVLMQQQGMGQPPNAVKQPSTPMEHAQQSQQPHLPSPQQLQQMVPGVQTGLPPGSVGPPQSPLQTQALGTTKVSMTDSMVQEKHTSIEKTELDRKEEESEADKKSKLNPFAKEFVPSGSAKSYAPRQQQPMQVPTPPRPSTQSPVVMGQNPMYPTYVMQGHLVQNTPPPLQNTQQPRHAGPTNKRVVVSAQRSEFSNAAAQAASLSGQPLLAQGMPSGSVAQYPVGQFNLPANFIAPQVYQQVMQMQSQSQPRMMQPQPHLIPAGSHQDPSGGQQTVPSQTPIFAVSAQQGGAIPGAPHVMPPPGGNPQQPSHSGPAHVAPHHHGTPPHSQSNSHINQSTPGTQLNPSPVPQHQHHPQQQNQQPVHPPTSGTPQPQLIYQGNPQMSQQGAATHPPLQPSPHTPTSPQTIYPPGMTFSALNYYNPNQHMMQAMPNQLTSSQQHSAATHTQHQQHSHNAPQMVFISAPSQHPSQNAPIQMNPGMHSNHTGGPQTQYQPHMQAHPVQGQGTPSLAPHTAAAMNMSSNTMHPQQTFFLSHPQSQYRQPLLQTQGPQHLSAYQQNQ